MPLCMFQLLDYEPKASRQVPLLLKMGKDQHALSKAIESGDTDLSMLAYSVITDFAFES